jgi:hypothetical protein
MDKARTRFRKTRPGIGYLDCDGRGNSVNGITISETMFHRVMIGDAGMDHKISRQRGRK